MGWNVINGKSNIICIKFILIFNLVFLLIWGKNYLGYINFGMKMIYL